MDSQRVKITLPEAFGRFQENDFERMDSELNRLNSLSLALGKRSERQFFYIPDKDVVLLEVYFDSELVSGLVFGN